MSDLSFSQRRHFLKLAERVDFLPGETIFKENGPGDSMLVIRQGKARVFKSFFGKSQHLAIREKGSVLGEMALIEDGPRSASVEAITRVETMRWSREAAMEFLEAYPRLAIGMLATVSGRLRQAQQSLTEELMQRNLELEMTTARLEARLREGQTLKQSNEELTQLASRDHLTGCLNRRSLDKELERWTADADLPFALMLLDVDNFKHYNDTNGHPAGDKLLKTLASVINSRLRSDDQLGRYGGEEFAVLWFGMRPERSAEVAERIRQAVTEYPFPEGHRQPLGIISFSGGLAHFPSEAGSPEDLLKLVDERLYQAKSGGRNRVVGPPQGGSLEGGDGSPLLGQ